MIPAYNIQIEHKIPPPSRLRGEGMRQKQRIVKNAENGYASSRPPGSAENAIEDLTFSQFFGSARQERQSIRSIPMPCSIPGIDVRLPNILWVLQSFCVRRDDKLAPLFQFVATNGIAPGGSSVVVLWGKISLCSWIVVTAVPMSQRLSRSILSGWVGASTIFTRRNASVRFLFCIYLIFLFLDSWVFLKRVWFHVPGLQKKLWGWFTHVFSPLVWKIKKKTDR